MSTRLRITQTKKILLY